MRVKISYTVEMEEVEKEVAEIMSKASSDLDEAFHEIVVKQNLIDTQTGNLEQYLETIDLARKRMMRADQVLEDCASILQGLSTSQESFGGTRKCNSKWVIWFMYQQVLTGFYTQEKTTMDKCTFLFLFSITQEPKVGVFKSYFGEQGMYHHI